MVNRIFDEQTNRCYFSRMLIEYSYGLNIVNRIMNCGIDVRLLEGTRDIWCRDFMPVQISEKDFVGYEYTPDYLEYRSFYRFQTNPARILRRLCIDVKQSGIILDGGNVIKTSKGIIMVDKVFSENRHIRKPQLTKRLETIFNSEIIFLPWDMEEKYGHADGIVREISDGTVLLTNYHQYDKIFAAKYMKILSRHFNVATLDYKVKNPCKYNWSYVNFLRVGDKVFIPQLTWEDYGGPVECAHSRTNFGNDVKPKWFHTQIEEDEQALEQFKHLMPNCEIIPVSCPQIVENGGGLNCISWNIKV